MTNAIFELFRGNVQIRAKEIRMARETYFIARAAEETIKEIAEDIQRKILSDGIYMVTPELCEETPKRITEPKHAYLMDDEIFLNDFLEKCYVEYQKAGIVDARGKEYIPEATAHDARREAEKTLLKLAIEIIPDDLIEKEELKKAASHWKYREQILDLILKLDI